MNLNKKDTYDSDIQKIRANYQKIKSYQSNLLTDPDFLSCKISQDSEIFLYKTKSGDSKILTIKQSIKNGVFGILKLSGKRKLILIILLLMRGYVQK